LKIQSWRNAVSLLCAAMILLSFSGAHAQNTDKLKISAGGFSVFKYDSTISLTSKSAGLGVAFSPEDTLGWKGEQTVFRVDGRYRITDKHALNLSWYRISSDGEQAIQKEIEWLTRDGSQTTIPLGAGVRSSLNYDIYKFAYRWSFYRSDKVELSVGAGIHLTDILIDLEATVIGEPVSTSKADSLVPLPVVSFRIGYDVTPKLYWFMQTEVFAISVGDWDGTYSDLLLGLEYRPLQHFGFGVGLGSNSLKVVEDARKHTFDFDNRISGINLYITGYF